MTNEEAIQFLENIKGEEAGRAIGKEGFYAELLGYHIEALNKAIEALKNEPKFLIDENGKITPISSQGEWIPIKTRPLTEEEKEEYPDFSFMYDCQMPEDQQEVLVSTKWGVRTDIYYKDVDGCYFENYCDEDDVLAWMPFPQPYKEADNEKR